MYLLIKILKKSEFMAAQRARPILLNERFLVPHVSRRRIRVVSSCSFLLSRQFRALKCEQSVPLELEKVLFMYFVSYLAAM